MRTLILTLVVKSDSHVHVRVEMKNTPFFNLLFQWLQHWKQNKELIMVSKTLLGFHCPDCLFCFSQYFYWIEDDIKAQKSQSKSLSLIVHNIIMDLKTSMLLTSSFLKNRLSVNALKLFYNTQLNDYLL